MRRAVWIVQWVLAALFLFAGGAKFALPAATLVGGTGLSVGFLHFIGVCEVAGAIGLVLPGLVHVREGLMTAAAVGLFVIMIGAVWITDETQGVVAAVLPFGTGLGLGFVVWGRVRSPGTPPGRAAAVQKG